MTHKSCKAAIRYFLQCNYSDERLAMLLAHAQSGRLAYNSCCCFVGVATANHGALASKGTPEYGMDLGHLSDALALPGGVNAELAYRYFGGFDSSDEVRRRRLIPMIRAEIWRRDRMAQQRREESPALEPATVNLCGLRNGVALGLLMWVGIIAALWRLV